ncbi:Calcium uniporter protein, C-terminal [Dillenia turbinata]|uniref:Calcium uniporter protein, C-terminal n=1 Tax=Dillenia turbinata TaxID=194707 RepID=A0AAN8UYG9_9MAGN
MAFKQRTPAQRLINISKMSTTPILTNCRISNPSTIKILIPPNPSSNQSFNPDPDPGDSGFFRRFLQSGAIFQSAKNSPAGIKSIFFGENLVQKIKSIDIAKDRIRLDGLSPPSPPPSAEDTEVEGFSVLDMRKVLKVAQLEMLKEKLRLNPKSRVSYSEFVELCSEWSPDPGSGIKYAKMLDESGSVIVLGDSVYLRPNEVAKAMEALLPQTTSPNDPRRKELEELEKQKAMIHKKAETLVCRELWGGLAYLIVQTAGFMRLTFWDLSWDVMEPICFYVTSFYFMACYAFFLRTSKEPSFEGFFQSRFKTKQEKLMRINNFDVERYNELRRVFEHEYAGFVTGSGSGSGMIKDLEKLHFFN